MLWLPSTTEMIRMASWVDQVQGTIHTLIADRIQWCNWWSSSIHSVAEVSDFEWQEGFRPNTGVQMLKAVGCCVQFARKFIALASCDIKRFSVQRQKVPFQNILEDYVFWWMVKEWNQEAHQFRFGHKKRPMSYVEWVMKKRSNNKENYSCRMSTTRYSHATLFKCGWWCRLSGMDTVGFYTHSQQCRHATWFDWRCQDC